MTDWALGANPKNRTSVITETGIVVYNAVQDADGWQNDRAAG